MAFAGAEVCDAEADVCDVETDVCDVETDVELMLLVDDDFAVVVVWEVEWTVVCVCVVGFGWVVVVVVGSAAPPKSHSP